MSIFNWIGWNQISVNQKYKSIVITLKGLRLKGDDKSLELSKELGRHNQMIEKAIDKQNRLAAKAQRIEDHIMSKEMYHYQ